MCYIHPFILLFNSPDTSDREIGTFITIATMYVLDTRFSKSLFVGITSFSQI